ncbi:phospholipase D-like domain-containing protein [Solimonas variicoloris]|uniref:phospholipase D-like domain-containing protein n=1 Tax=Solimonas variicoloris TaxID=254408 RepID=UPI0003618D51|nr:phospholipase D-like domain-containing protein [Solimonas variicoloris]
MRAQLATLQDFVVSVDWAAVLLPLWLAIAVGTAGHALLTRRDARAAWGWIAVCWLFPFAGPLLYFFFGINRIRTHARRFSIDRSGRMIGSAHASDARRAVAATGVVPGWLDEVARTADVLTRRPLLGGNRIEPLHDGEQAFPRMLAAIEAARETVWLASYIFDNDAVGRSFVAALAAARRRGVQVRVLIDDVGERYSLRRIGTPLRAAGLDVARFNPLRLLPPSLHLNLRNHRKLLLVDHETGFTGGMNLSARHLTADTGKRHRVADLHFALHGPIVQQMSEVFAEDWAFATRERLALPPAPPCVAGGAVARVITDGPNEDLDQLNFVLQAALAAARREVLIMTPYFLPSAELIAALQGAALRGVRTVVLLPARNNLPYVDWAMRHQLGPLLERGVRVRFQPGPFCHSKLLVVDHAYTLIGSANWDPRSLLLNFELNVELYDPALARQMAAHFLERWQLGEELLLRDAQHPPFAQRVRNALCWLFSPYL